jgi:DNA-binding response OmpR family regulator
MSKSKNSAQAESQWPSAEPVVYVVDDDISVREALGNLLRSVGLNVALFTSALEFRQHDRGQGPACLVLDVRLPGMSGLDLQSELTQLGDRVPIIFITGHGDVPMSVRAMKGGAIEFLQKPFREQDLLDAINTALAKSAASASHGTETGAPQTPGAAALAGAAAATPAAGAVRSGGDEASPRQALARNMQLARAIFNWSQEELGGKCGLYRSHISALEREELSVGVDTIDSIAAAFGVPSHVLLMPPKDAQARLLESFNGIATTAKRSPRAPKP